ncbi:MAG TPA: flavodoxin domain-containing protein [Microbacteriaceae bacterium]
MTGRAPRDMRALVVYESLWGNTEQVARAIATEFGLVMPVDIVDSDAAPDTVDAYDFVAVGGPTHAFSMSRLSTRREAVGQHGAPGAPERGIREWLAGLGATSRRSRAITFDTRVNAPRLPGSAAKAAKYELRSLGLEVVASKTFRVHGYGGPLIDGELERAREWAHTVVQATSAA